MITPRSALKFDLFADASRKRKIDEQSASEERAFVHLLAGSRGIERFPDLWSGAKAL